MITVIVIYTKNDHTYGRELLLPYDNGADDDNDKDDPHHRRTQKRWDR